LSCSVVTDAFSMSPKMTQISVGVAQNEEGIEWLSYTTWNSMDQQWRDKECWEPAAVTT